MDKEALNKIKGRLRHEIDALKTDMPSNINISNNKQADEAVQDSDEDLEVLEVDDSDAGGKDTKSAASSKPSSVLDKPSALAALMRSTAASASAQSTKSRKPRGSKAPTASTRGRGGKVMQSTTVRKRKPSEDEPLGDVENDADSFDEGEDPKLKK